jgi:hypothetical protein
MSIFSRLNPFSRGRKSRPISERLGGYEPPEYAKPWEPSERPPELPWEQDENGSGVEASQREHPLGRPVAEDPAHARAPADAGFEIRARTEPAQESTPPAIEEPQGTTSQPVYLDDFRSEDELPPGWTSSRFG